MRAAILALVLLAGAAQAQTLDCQPGKGFELSVGLTGAVATWPCVVNTGAGYVYRWNRAVATWGAIPDAGELLDALRAPEVAPLNKLLAGRTCSESTTVAKLCTEANAIAAQAVLPTLWQTRPASWGGVSVYKLVNGVPDVSKPAAVIGRVLCDCSGFSQDMGAGNRLCKTQPAGVSFCFPAP